MQEPHGFGIINFWKSTSRGIEKTKKTVDTKMCGGLAQLGEHYVRNVGVAGSTPVPSTKFINQRGYL